MSQSRVLPTNSYTRCRPLPHILPTGLTLNDTLAGHYLVLLRHNKRKAALHRGTQAIVHAGRGAYAATTTALAPDAFVEPSARRQASSPPQLDGELELLLRLLPPAVRAVLEVRQDIDQLLEVVLDLGRPPSARFPHGDVELSTRPLTWGDLEQAVAQVGQFDGDNRAGINSTLHRISCLRNRGGRIVGLTCRVGRSVPGAAALVRDLVVQGRSVLLLGRPGVGKTTALREVCRIAADESQRRVVIVDTSNEIGGDGDVPHHSIGGARRMQVPRPEAQHAVMVEAVENHMPQVVVIDEISTLAECAAARTIAQRGVQLVATAHGDRLENVIKNPTLADLVGGVQTVTLGDEEARRRGVQKSILERAAPPTFDVAVEMEERGRWRVHLDVAAAVDTLLAGGEASGQVRFLDDSGQVTRATYMGLVRRTDSTTGAITTSEWWADEAGEQEPLLWPTRQDGGRPVGLPTPSSSSSFSTSSPFVAAPSAAAAAAAPSSRAAAVAAAVAPLSSALRESAAARSTANGARDPAAAAASSNSSSSSSSSSSGALGRAKGAAAAMPLDPPPPPLPPRMRAYLVMDGEATARVKAVLGLLRRQIYEAAVAAGGAEAGGAVVAAAAAAAAAATAAAPAGPGGAAEYGNGGGPQDSLIELVPELDMADMVIGTKSKLRNTPKIRNAARKRDLPIYALTATSTSALLRNLCPLLGLDPLAVTEVVRAAGSSVDEEQQLGSSEGEEEEAGQEGTATSTAPSSSSSSSASGSNHRRSLELSAADDYAELLLTTVRELRYAPLDRSYTQHILGRFVEEMMAAPPAAAAARSATTATTTTTTTTATTTATTASGDSSDGSDGSTTATATATTAPASPPTATATTATATATSSPAALTAPSSEAAAAARTASASSASTSEATVRASSLAAVAWACSFVKHRKKFVEASRRELGLLAAACGERWDEFSPQDVTRAASGFAALRLAPPSAAWLEGLARAAQAALGQSQQQQQQQQEVGVGAGAGRRAGGLLSADDASRLQLAVAELEVLWHAQEGGRQGQDAGGSAS